MKINYYNHIGDEKDFNENFYVKENEFMGTSARLITPKISAKWNKTNRIFRSSIWDMKGNLLSGGFFKFVNAFEKPEEFPLPVTLENTQCLTKYDGSLCIFDVINDILSARTRGTFSYKQLDNYKDFDYCILNYPMIFEWLRNAGEISVLTEITTPNQRIVLSYGDKPDLTLIGVVDKNNYSLWSQHEVDRLGKILGIKRPEYHNINNLDELVSYVKPRKDIEGICLYSNNGQSIHKIKTDHYLKLHHLKSDISSFEKVVELFFSLDCPSYQIFYDTIKSTFDFELAEFAKENLQQVTILYQELTKTLKEISDFVLTLDGLSRKDAALQILEKYKGLSSFAFNFLNKKQIENKDKIKKIIEWNKRFNDINKTYEDSED